MVVDEKVANTSEVAVIFDGMFATISPPEKRGANTAFAPFSGPSHALQACFHAANPEAGFQARTTASGIASARCLSAIPGTSPVNLGGVSYGSPLIRVSKNPGSRDQGLMTVSLIVLIWSAIRIKATPH